MNSKNLKILISINLLLAGLLIFQLIKNNNSNNSNPIVKDRSLIFMPDSRYYPPYCKDYYELYAEFKTEPNLNILEKKLHDRLKVNICDEYYYLLGRIEEKRKNWNNAIEYYRKAAKVFPLRSYFLRIAMIYKVLGNEDEKELALDMASITIGNKWCNQNDSRYYNDFLQSKRLSKSSYLVRNALTFNRPLHIKIITELVKKGDIKKAFSEYDKIMKDSFRFHYDFDRMIKLFVPFFPLEMNKHFSDNYMFSYWDHKFFHTIGMVKFGNIFHKKGTLKLTTNEVKILNHYYKLCKFGNKIVRASLDFGKYGMGYSKMLLGYNGFQVVALMDNSNLKYDYLKLADFGNLGSLSDYSFYINSKHKSNWTVYGNAPEKWLNNMIQSF